MSSGKHKKKSESFHQEFNEVESHISRKSTEKGSTYHEITYQHERAKSVGDPTKTIKSYC